MAASANSTPSLTPSPSRSPTPVPPVQPDHFYSPDGDAHPAPLSPESLAHSWLSADDDPLATKGIPVFRPTMDEFRDFEAYMNRVECWGMRSGIIKIIPPKEWIDALPSTLPQLSSVRINSPIEQHMLGHAGLFRVQNVVRRKAVSVREWAELCAKEDYRAPGVDEVGLKAAGEHAPHVKRRNKRRSAVAAKEEEVLVKAEGDEGIHIDNSAPLHELATPIPGADADSDTELVNEQPGDGDHPSKSRASPVRKRRAPTREERGAAQAKRTELDDAFLEIFDPHTAWLPRNTSASDYTPSFCATLERRYWRNCGLGKPPWYGADTAGTLFTDATQTWNVGSLPSALSRLLPKSSAGLPGVNTPYLYFGMWRATFAWHVEDMDLHSINYIHWGAPKHWYAIPQGRSMQLENILGSFFPSDASKCRQFLRHKSFHASPTLLAQQGCKPNVLVQHAGEFVITYPRGYHAGFNLGFNCAESVNFALDSWLEIGRKAQACACIGDSVRIDVDALLRSREEERLAEEQTKAGKPPSKPPSKKPQMEGEGSEKAKSSKKRKSDTAEGRSRAKKQKHNSDAAQVEPPSSSSDTRQKLFLKLPRDPGPYPCCLCVSRDTTNLLRVHDPPGSWSGSQNVPAKDGLGKEIWRAHEKCALLVPETWVDEETNEEGEMEKVVFGVDGIVKGRWALKCSLCQNPRARTHGAKIQCTKGKCPKAFHISCARDGGQGNRVQLSELREVEKEVVLNDVPPPIEAPSLSGDESVAVSSNDMTIDTGTADASLAPTALPVVSSQVAKEATPELNVVKTIKKIEYELLCPQHNPVVAAARRASKVDRVRNELLALPAMSRVKLRVSSGVFEVSLLAVNEERGTIEVIWDHGIKREFKWSSLVWGKTETVGQKPTVAAPPPEKVYDTPNHANRSATPIVGPSNPNQQPYTNYSNYTVGQSRYGLWPNPYYPYIQGVSGNTSNPLSTADASRMQAGMTPYFNSSAANQPPMASLTWSPAYGQQGYSLPFSRTFAQTISSSVSLLPPRAELAGSDTFSGLPEIQNLPSSPGTISFSVPLNTTRAPSSSTGTSGSGSRPPGQTQSTSSTEVGGVPVPSEVMQAIAELQKLSSLDQETIKDALRAQPALTEAVKVLVGQQTVPVPAVT
ncbi:JmjC-domain-containing protein [Sanghuangporus baumii]|uniref:[histone H3]-trimethyl-L-lysine(9) demethylase n=1 Tax=Sanghuangporus baumii TaxID=108892 RepID=A0A9Q5I3J4_SANBA|nr:JmjC-domain-containing protein [Sanghuangporus baumii]